MRPAKASPFGRGVCAADGEGKPGTKEHLHSDKHWLLIESSYRCVFVLSQRPCPLRRSAPAPPKGEPLACRTGQSETRGPKFFGHGIALLSTEAGLSLLRKDKPSAGREMWPGLPMALPRLRGLQRIKFVIGRRGFSGCWMPAALPASMHRSSQAMLRPSSCMTAQPSASCSTCSGFEPWTMGQ